MNNIKSVWKKEFTEAELVIINKAFEEAFLGKCECGSTEGLSKHITTPTGHVSFSEPLCLPCRQELSKGVLDVYRKLRPWELPIEEQREIANQIVNEGGENSE